jgi:hypothetical protein
MTSRPSINPWFEMRNESTHNWLALGLLLAAWNFSDNDAVRMAADKPPTLQNHAVVTVRTARAHDI